MNTKIYPTKSRFKTELLLLFTVVGLAISTNGFAQSKKEQIKALKVAFITEQLKLTAAEAEKFWPIYNLYEAKNQELRKQKMKSVLDGIDDSSIDKMSDKEANNFLNQMEDTEEAIYLNRKKFFVSIKSVVSPAKVIKFKKAEEDFNRKLLRQYRNKFKK